MPQLSYSCIIVAAACEGRSRAKGMISSWQLSADTLSWLTSISSRPAAANRC